MQRVEAYLNSIPGGRILDVATGRGEFVHFLLATQNPIDIVALDIMTLPEGRFEQQFPDQPVHYVVGDAYQLPLGAQCFDTVALSNSLHHFENPQQVISEMWRVLKPGGTLILNEMLSDKLTAPQTTHLMIHHWSAEADRISGRYHRETYSLPEVMAIMTESCISITEQIEYEPLIENPFDPDIMQSLSVTIDRIQEGLAAKPETAGIAGKADTLRRQLSENGFAPARAVFLTALK